MGVTLPKPLMTKVCEYDGNQNFRLGSACVNGFRENMEDAHLSYMRDNWGFFAVFDGHVNDKCSAYLETAFKEYLEKNPGPMSDERMKEMALKIDQKWLDTEKEGGSTGTFFMAHKEGNTVHMQVGNVGDSRVLVSKCGRCLALTEDHKPSREGEQARIEAYGGRVEHNRVDGSLAISRAFGDRDYKQSPGGQLNQKVIALADITHTEVTFGSNDFAVLCCDGVFESNFTNKQVIEFVQEKLKETNDLVAVAGMVCDEAVARGSRDNISCMIVQFKDGSDYAAREHVQVIPGPFNAPKSAAFLRMYKEMVLKGGMPVEVALEKRYAELDKANDVDEEEREAFGSGPPKNLSGKERSEWFLKMYEELVNKPPQSNRSEQLARFSLLQQQTGVPIPVLLALMNEQADAGS